MWAALAAVLIGAIDLSVIATILPSIITDLGVNTADIDRFVWIVNAYLIAYIVALPLAGRLSDIVGRRGVFLASLVIFVAGSVVCAQSGSLDGMITGRAIQGFGGGALVPVTMALAADRTPDANLPRAIGRIAAIDTLGWLIGPTYGALIVAGLGNAHEAWRWVFWLNVPIAAVVAALVWREVPPQRGRRSLRELDLPGALLLTVAISALCLGLTSSGELASTESGLRAFGGTPNPMADRLPLLLGITLIAGALLVARVRTAPSPILPRSLFRDGTVAGLIANFLIGTVMMIAVVNVPVVVALLEPAGAISRVSAILLAALTGGIALTASLGGVHSRFGARAVMMAGLALAVAGSASLYPLLEPLEVWWILPGLALLGLGVGLLLAPLGTIGLRGSSDEHGSGAAAIIMARLLGMTIGVSLLTALGVRRLQHLTDRLEPVTQEAGESTASFLARQQAFILDHAIPLAVQVLQETFLAGAILAAIASIPIARLLASGVLERGNRLSQGGSGSEDGRSRHE